MNGWYKHLPIEEKNISLLAQMFLFETDGIKIGKIVNNEKKNVACDLCFLVRKDRIVFVGVGSQTGMFFQSTS